MKSLTDLDIVESVNQADDENEDKNGDGPFVKEPLQARAVKPQPQ